jgi:hypothetical protein
MLVIRCMTIVMIGLLGGRWVTLYVVADLCLYLLVKILRGDFWYWIPLGGNVEIVSSIVCRVLVKVVGDFTSIVHFRHPYEVGGLYWVLGFVLTIGSLPVAIILAERGDVADHGLKFARTVMGLVIPFTMISLAVFFTCIDRNYWSTFYSLERGKDGPLARFSISNDDKKKARAIFENSKHYWKSIEEEVRTWVQANWERWEDEKPDWFDDAMRAKVPVEYIPGAGNARKRESMRRSRIGSQDEGGLAGSLRASFRRASVGGAGSGDIIGVGGGKAKVSSVVPLEDLDGE